jgi:hypothetical protein
VTLRALAGNMPPELKLPLLRRLRPAQAEGLARSLAHEKESNLAVIAAGQSIPVRESLCYLGNYAAQGYLSARSDIWAFPDYYADVRYFLVQKDANDLNTMVVPKAGETLEALAARTKWANVQGFPLAPEASALIRRTLVDEKRTHRVVAEDAHVLLLENLHPNTPVSAPSTHGFGWLRNLGRRPQRVARPPVS